MTDALTLCACGQPATAITRNEMLCDACQASRGRVGATLDQGSALPWPAEAIGWFRKRVRLNNDHGSWNDAARWLVTLAKVEQERDAALAHASNLAAVVERVADRLTAEDGADVAALVARVARERQTEREALARAEAERDALRAATRAFFATCNRCAECDGVAVWYSRIHGEHYCDADACKPPRDESRPKECLTRCLNGEERALLALLPPEAL